jgi:hypothetical protein
VTVIRPDVRRGLDGGICARIADDEAVEQPVPTGLVVKDMKHSGRSGREPAGR